MSRNRSLFLPCLAGALASVAGSIALDLGLGMWRLKIAKSRLTILGIIPAQGKSQEAIKIAWENARRTSMLNHIVVATDDEEIADVCRRFGADILIISESCRNGIECCIEALCKKGKYDIVINIQGDFEPKIIDDFMDIQKLSAAVKYEEDETLEDFMACVDLKLLEDGGYEKVLEEVSLDDIVKRSH